MKFKIVSILVVLTLMSGSFFGGMYFSSNNQNNSTEGAFFAGTKFVELSSSGNELEAYKLLSESQREFLNAEDFKQSVASLKQSNDGQLIYGGQTYQDGDEYLVILSGSDQNETTTQDVTLVVEKTGDDYAIASYVID